MPAIYVSTGIVHESAKKGSILRVESERPSQLRKERDDKGVQWHNG